MLSKHLVLCCPLLLLPSIFPSIRVFSSESAFHITWPKYWSFGISSSNEYSGLISFQFSSVAHLCPTLWDPMDCSMPGFPVHHQLLELAQTHVDQVDDAIQPSHPLSSPSPSAVNLSQHQCLSNESVLRIRWPKDWSCSISSSNEYSGLISLGISGFTFLLFKGLSRVFSSTTI